MSKTRVVSLTAVAIIAIPSSIHSQEPSLATVVERLENYAMSFQRQFSNIVAEERYTQDVTYRNLPPNRFVTETHRVLRSDVLLVHPSGSDRYIEFRDVFEVDGRPIRDRQDRLTTLFLNPSASAEAQIQQINRESARYNIGNVERTINTPTLPLQFLLSQNQPRFRFERSRRTAPALNPVSGTPPPDTVIEYQEVQRPTLIRTTGALDLPARGRFWTDSKTGRVFMTEVILGDSAVRATIDVSYQWDPQAELMVPAEMRERYETRRDGAVIVGAATYGKVRQFQVQAKERLGPALPVVIDQQQTNTPAQASEPIANRDASDFNVQEGMANKPAETDVAPVPLSVPSPQDLATPPAFKTGTELVLVDFVVTDKADHPVRGLSAKDFVVKEDGRERPSVSFEAFATAGASSMARSSPVPGATPPSEPAAVRPPDASTVVLVDDAHLTPDQAARLRPALKGLLTTVGGRSGSLMMVAPGSKVSVLAVLPAGAAAILPAVDRIVGLRIDEHSTFPLADAEALAIARRDNPTIARVAARYVTFNPELSVDQATMFAIERGIQVAHDARVRRDAMYDVALLSLDWLAARGGRHSLIIVSGGFATDPDDTKYVDVVTRSLRANAPIDFLDARGLSGFDRYHDVEFGTALSRDSDEGPLGRFEAAEGSSGLAVDTGGVIVANTNDMKKGLDQLLDTMTTYYVLAYQPPTNDKSGYHKIKVEVRAKGLHVRARTGYRSGQPASR